jgi:hypothetical protein
VNVVVEEEPRAQRWHATEIMNGGDWRETRCYLSEAQARVEVELKIMDMEEDGWVETPHPGGMKRVEFPPPWGRGKVEGFDERPHIWSFAPCSYAEARACPSNPAYDPKEVAKLVREVGQYTNFRCAPAIIEDPVYLERPEGVIRARALVKYTCQHKHEVEVIDWSEAGARDTFVQLIRGKCPDCRRQAGQG